MKKNILISIIFLLSISLLTGCNPKESKPKEEEKIYEISFKVNPLVKFKFKYKEDVATITEFELVNEKAKEIFKDTDFKDMELNKAIDLYGDALKNENIDFETIYVLTTWDKTDYFKSEKYNLSVKKYDNLDDIEDLTKPKFLYDEKYYLTQNEYGYSLTFHEDGTITYYQEKEEERKYCDEYDESDCHTFTIVPGEIPELSSKVKHELKDGYVYITGKTEDDCYQGWCRSYDKCEIAYNKLVCDFYSGLSGLEIAKRWTTIYEIR